jgi:hypothetical protein
VSQQLALFESLRPQPEGLRHAADFVSPETERRLISGIRDLPLLPFQFGQFEGKRRVASFGFRYDYALRQLQRSEPIPAWLDKIVVKVEAFGGPATQIRQVLCTGIRRRGRYWRPFAGIRLQIPVSQGRRQDLGSFYARCRTPFALHDVRRVTACLGAQHSCRGGTTLFDHVSHDEWT